MICLREATPSCYIFCVCFRSKQMAVDQDWGSVWPGPRSFQPATVPLPIHQGFVPKNEVSPGKFANAELMKIPNFLHLTPPVIKRQCEALKKFCTPWPANVETDEKIAQHFPIDVITSGSLQNFRLTNSNSLILLSY